MSRGVGGEITQLKPSIADSRFEPLTHTKAAVRNMSCDPFNQLHFTNDVKPAFATRPQAIMHRDASLGLLLNSFSHFLTRHVQGTLSGLYVKLCS